MCEKERMLIVDDEIVADYLIVKEGDVQDEGQYFVVKIPVQVFRVEGSRSRLWSMNIEFDSVLTEP